MDNRRLNHLAAIAMGWDVTQDYGVATTRGPWNPVGCSNDALILLEKCAGNADWDLTKGWCGYFCDMEMIETASSGWVKTPSLAITLCALRAGNIPESEIISAMIDGHE